jgi:hypothetical protein
MSGLFHYFWDLVKETRKAKKAKTISFNKCGF